MEAFLAKTISDRLKKEFRQEMDEILSWWVEHLIDETSGGFYGRIDSYGNVHSTTDKAIILNTRILWTFSAAAPLTKLESHQWMAHRAYDYICQNFWDDEEGGMYWSVDYQGNPSDTQKQMYGQAFGVYAFSEYYALTQKVKAIRQAEDIFELIEKYSLDKVQNGYLSAFARDWSMMDDIRLSDKDANEAKIMNTHLHILEAYTNLYRIKSSTKLKEALHNTIELFLDRFYIPERGSIQVYFDENWQAKGETISFGHNIEASWLLWEAAQMLADPVLIERVRPVCIHLARSVMEIGLDEDGALFYEADLKGMKNVEKHWWVQAEAVVGFFNAWQLTGEEAFLEAALSSWEFIKTYIKDTKNGEWYWCTYKDRTPRLEEDKAGPWKAPYHNVRMCLEMLRRLENL